MYISTYAVLIEKFCTQQYNKEKTLRERKTEHVAINLDKELVSCNVSSMPPDAYAVWFNVTQTVVSSSPDLNWFSYKRKALCMWYNP